MGRAHDHYLAKTHLRGFSFDGKRLWQMDRSTQASRTVSIRDAAVERGLNTVKHADTSNRDLERYMATENESPAAPVLERLRNAETGPLALNVDDNAALARYIALTYARSPAWRAQSPTRTKAAIVALARQYEDPLEFARKVAAAGIRMDPLAVEVARLGYLVDLRRGLMPPGTEIDPWVVTVATALGGRAAPILAAMAKVIVHRDRAPFMVCGDCAVVLMMDGQYFGPGQLGIGTSNVRVVVPLSSEAFLVCTQSELAAIPGLVAHWASDAFASFVNRATVEHATRFVFARDREDLHHAVSEHAASRIAD